MSTVVSSSSPRRSSRPSRRVSRYDGDDDDSTRDDTDDDTDDDTTHAYPVGTRIYKEFPGHGWFGGHLAEPLENNLYFVVYDDGDEETLSPTQMHTLVRQAVQQQKQQPLLLHENIAKRPHKRSKSDSSNHTNRTTTGAHMTTAAATTTTTTAADVQPTRSRHMPPPRQATVPKKHRPVDSDDDDSSDEAMTNDTDEDDTGNDSSRYRSSATVRRPRSSSRSTASRRPNYRSVDPSDESEWDGTDAPMDDNDDDNSVSDSSVAPTQPSLPTTTRRRQQKQQQPVRHKAKPPTTTTIARPHPSHTSSADATADESHVDCLIRGIDFSAPTTVIDFNDNFLIDDNAHNNNNTTKAVSKHARTNDDATAKTSKNRKNDNGATIGYDKTPYTVGADLPILADIPLMFDDMIREKVLGTTTRTGAGTCTHDRNNTNNINNGGGGDGTHHSSSESRLVGLLQRLHQRPLRIATMCSGTESPILALDMIQTAIRDAVRDQPERFADLVPLANRNGHDTDGVNTLFPMKHVFSCEIEPFKQAYIERNFSPPILFRDIRELGLDQAQTAYGSMVDVPNQPGCVDVLIAGTSCVDYSNLNNQKKSMEEQGESGATFYGMIRWIKKAQPPIVIIENVFGAPWDVKVGIFEEAGYVATFMRLDTKDYYIPHTRQRGYLVAILGDAKKSKHAASLTVQWKEMVESLKRPASATLDDFMLPNDDPRVLRGRARLTMESLSKDSDSAGRIDWTKCETRHQTSRSIEELGDKRPLTDWSDSGHTAMPSFCWNEWVNAQVHRIHDLMDVNTLRLAQAGLDCTYLVMVWNLSQNVDRDTMGKLGLCQCLTPTGVPYVTNRGGPLVGEELLMLQGIPVDDLLFTKETEDNLKDLAGNAMSTTVVGACILAALLVGYEALPSHVVPGRYIDASLVPRPLTVPTTSVALSREFGVYENTTVNLSPAPLTLDSWCDFLKDAFKSRRMCASEGPDESLPLDSIVRCRDCGHTSSVTYAIPARRFEKHDYHKVSATASRIEPSAFRERLLSLLPMRFTIDGFDLSRLMKPDAIDSSIWVAWLDSAMLTLIPCVNSPIEFRFIHLKRTHIWTATYGSQNRARLEARVTKEGVTWLLFPNAPPKIGAQFAELPLARMVVKPVFGKFTLVNGSWELCLPVSTKVKVSIARIGERVSSWRNRLGLKGRYENEMESEKLQICVESSNNEEIQRLKVKIDGCYKLLPDCGGACGSLRKKEDSMGEDMYFFLSAGRQSLAKDNAYVVASSCHRTAYEEFRDISMHIESGFTPLLANASASSSSDVASGVVHGKWVTFENATTKTSIHPFMNLEAPTSKLMVPFSLSGHKVCPVLLACTVLVRHNDDLVVQCEKLGKYAELNLQKSKKIFADLSFATSRLRLPIITKDEDWLELKYHSRLLEKKEIIKDDSLICHECAPAKPRLQWTEVKRGNRTSFVPIEDGQEAAKYEQAIKARPRAWLFQIKLPKNPEHSNDAHMSLTIGCNPCSLVQRALGLLPVSTLSRNSWLDVNQTRITQLPNDCSFEWRAVPHVETSFAGFAKLRFTSNRYNDQANQPPNFKSHPLRKEQLRSLNWMLNQESTNDPFYEEEVSEEVLPSLKWRAEGRVRRPVLVRGGIIADAVGYGKTAITLGLIDSTDTENRAPPIVPSCYKAGFIHTKATLIVVPKHLMGQWPDEVKKFLDDSKHVEIIKDIVSWERLRVTQIQKADIVIVSFDILTNEKYLSNLAMLCGLNQASLPRGNSGGRHFSFVYKSCLEILPKRVGQIQHSTTNVMNAITLDCKIHDRVESERKIQMDGKKAAYNSGKSTTSTKASKPFISNKDPWGLSKQATKDDFTQMTCPPLELFFWNRLVVDEFTYLSKKKDRERLLEFTYNLKSSFRWYLSGTPDHNDFNDVNILGRMLGIHLGVEEVLPTVKLSKKFLVDSESTGLESMSHFLESRSLQWHYRRHALCQTFLNRFVRQNVAEIDEIRFTEELCPVTLPAPEMAIYTELETHLESLDMSSKNAQKGKRKAGGDRETRMDTILQGSQTGEEALLKCCSHYNMSGSSTALETLDNIIQDRQGQKYHLSRVMTKELVKAFSMRQTILNNQPDWSSTVTLTGKGEMVDALGSYLRDVRKNASIFPKTDDEVNRFVHRLARSAKEVFNAINAGRCKNSLSPKKSKAGNRKRKTIDDDKDDDISEEGLIEIKVRLRNHMHKVRALGKELSGRIRSLRFIDNIRKVQRNTDILTCPMCSRQNTDTAFGVLSCCGHNGCLECLKKKAIGGHCVVADCGAHVSPAQIVATDRFALDRSDAMTEQFGRKLTCLVAKVKDIVEEHGDRLIVFCQFDDLISKVKEALTAKGISSLEVKGTVGQQIKTVAIFQKEVPDPFDPHVLLLKMDDEQSAGLNLTYLNHAIFVHPLSAATQQDYDAYETQAIGRIRRYGQRKTVHVWRFLASDTIDTRIYAQRTAQLKRDERVA